MTRLFPLLVVGLSFFPRSQAMAQKDNVAGGFPPDKEMRAKIESKIDDLGLAIAVLKKKGLKDPLLGDVEVFQRAGRVMLRNNDFHSADAAKQTLEMLDQGLKRANTIDMLSEKDLRPGTRSVRAYRSQVDGSLQPYIVSLPANYGKDGNGTFRLDVVLHGRNNFLTEAGWLRSNADRTAGKDPWVQIEPFGRGNNAFRWAGETDVFEALEDFFAREKAAGRADLLDRKKIVLRGFSMGGAGTWHMGLHHPDLWCAIGPGAGFSATAGLPRERPKAWDDCLHIYDAVDYSRNAFMVPVVAYSGADDPQKLAADNIEKMLKKLDLSAHMTHLIAPNTKHVFGADYFKKADALWSVHAAKGRDPYPAEVRFTIFTLKYPRCEWLEILRLDRHYQEAKVAARHNNGVYEVEAANVRMLRLHLTHRFNAKSAFESKVRIKINGATIEARSHGPEGFIDLEHKDNQWKVRGEPSFVGVEKVHGLTGPIDDAFTEGFLCVTGTSKPWNPAVEEYAASELKRFTYEWQKYMRGDLPRKRDVDVNADDISNKNLILFGDPGSNALIAKALPKLPFFWAKDEVTLDVQGKAANHVPVLICPNPLNPKKYLVLNSGHTFKEAEFKATNAFLFPRLGDYALLKLSPTDPIVSPNVRWHAEPVAIGIFDERWEWLNGRQ